MSRLCRMYWGYNMKYRIRRYVKDTVCAVFHSFKDFGFIELQDRLRYRCMKCEPYLFVDSTKEKSL